jgi:hypothetical protein
MWVKQTDTLNKDDYNNLKQDLAKMQLYSRALSGATYLYTSSTSSIYESISYKDNNSWYIDPISSPYNSMGLPSSGMPINSSNFNEYKDYAYEYGFTLKNLFTPTKAIDVLNIINVSAATTGAIDLNSTTFSTIDGIELKEGNLVLVKNQLSTVDLAYTVDPNLYFAGNYYFVNDNIADITYEYYDATNGVYEFSDGALIKMTMATYSSTSQLSIYVNLGNTYQDKQFALSRLLNGYYPIEGQPFEFIESHNYLVRNQVDYHNLYETNYYDVLKHATQSLTIEGYTYTIPQRLLYVGDFGVILNQQDTTYSQYLFNNCKENLKCITQTAVHYWACGDNGTILKISKLDLSITKIDLGEEFHNLTSISFLDDINGIVVGKYNTIYRTFDGGYTWRKILIGKDNYSYNRVFYYNYNLIYIAGETGVFCELKYSDTSGYTPNFINLVKNLSLTDTYDLIEDINDMYYTHFDTWGLTYAVPVDLMAGNGINYSMECLFMVTNNNLMCYEINNFVTEHAVLYLAFSQSIGNLNSITRQKGTDIMYVAGDNIISFDINTFKYASVTSNQVSGTTSSLISDSQYTNRLFDYNGEYIYNVGNFASIYERNYSTVSTYISISTETITPRMLFMEYDMADKLNFFDSDYNYRLPNTITFSSYSGATNSYISYIQFLNNESTWIDYTKDVYKTYGVNSDTSSGNTVTFNTIFSSGTSSISLNNSDICLDYNSFKSLYPYADSATHSKYAYFTLSAPSVVAKIYAYKNIIIFNISNFCDVGDIIKISTQNFEATVMINKSISGYFYAFNDFNQAMLNSLRTTSVTLVNLNRYSDIVNYSDLLTNFNEHPLSNGFKLKYLNKLFTINPLFNNYTAYKDMNAEIWVQYSNVYVSTVIGASGSGYIDGISTEARITRPGYIYYKNNNIYFSDGGTNSSYNSAPPNSWRTRIRKLDLTTNIVTTIAGGIINSCTHSGDGGLAVNAGLFNPTAIVIDNNENLLFTEFDDSSIYGGSFIRKIDTNGIITTICGNGSNISSGDGGLAILAGVSTPQGIAIDSSQNIYICEARTSKIRKIDAITGIITTYYSTSLNYPNNISIFDDVLYISNGGGYRNIIKIDLNIGISSASIYINTSTWGFGYLYPASITFDIFGDAYLAGEYTGGQGKIFKKNNITGNISLIAGGGTNLGDGYPPLETNMDPLTIVLGDNNNIYFNDAANNKIRKIKFNDSYNSNYSSYTTFNLFGYTPNYSLLNYLSTINSGFTASKKFYTMPEYTGLPCNGAGNFTENNIYYDSNQPLAGTVSFPKNKLIFGNNLKYEYDTLWVNTFVDLTLTTNAGTFNKTQVLITDKYYDETFGGWALLFNDSIIKTDDGFTHYGVALNSINIISRNTLDKISADLEIFNNLNKPLVSKKYNSGLYYMNIYDNPIKTKINTDSYTKILLSDGDIKKYITSIIYTNDKNILTMNVVNISKTEDININNTFIVGSNLALATANLHDINGSLSAYLIFNGGTGSSQELNPNYNGIHTVNKLDDYDLTVNTPYLNYPPVIDTGILRVNIFDPFFNYQPVNLVDVTDNRKYKIPTILTPYNFYSIGLTNSLINLNLDKPAFRLIDGLDIDTLATNYHWILEAEISDAIIGLDSNGIVWYSGIWHSGRWFGGTWYSGTWISGDWYSGTWNSVQTTDKVTSVIVGQSSYDNKHSMWYSGRWFDGYWQAGTWLDGRWYNGTWNDGLWFNGIWNDGKWNSGTFYGGIWVRGYWTSGIFNAFNKPAYWIDGTFNSGDFQNGIWYNGTFGINYNTLNKFGASASNSRNAVWHGGVWASGNFYSSENINGLTVSVSTTHKYSNWRTGVWNKGNFYGGIVYNIEFKAGTWYGGIVNSIEVIGLNPMSNQITLNGEFRFNIGDYINIITDGTSTPYSAIGNYNQPGKYKVALTEFDYTNSWTILTLNYDFDTLGLTGYYGATASSDIDTGLRLVSKYNNIDWYSGIWYDGIFDGGNFYGGMWYDGVFLNGTWGV